MAGYLEDRRKGGVRSYDAYRKGRKCGLIDIKQAKTSLAVSTRDERLLKHFSKARKAISGVSEERDEHPPATEPIVVASLHCPAAIALSEPPALDVPL